MNQPVLLQGMSQKLVHHRDEEAPHKELPLVEQLDKLLARLQPAGWPLHTDRRPPVHSVGHGAEMTL